MEEEYPTFGVATSRDISQFMYKVYAWMFAGLFISGITAYAIAISKTTLVRNPVILIGLVVAQLALVIALSAFLMRLSYPVALGMYLLYSFLMGLTLSFIFTVYTSGSIVTTFFITAGMFGSMALYGYFTKTDLTKLGNILFMMLIGVILSFVVNMFVKSTLFDLLISIVGVVVFTLLTAYDSQKLKEMAQRFSGTPAMREKLAIFGSLMLYLDFLNLFLLLLRLFGRQRD